MITGVLCALSAEQVAQLASGQDVRRAVLMPDGSVILVIVGLTDREMVAVQGHWAIAECAPAVERAIKAEGEAL